MCIQLTKKGNLCKNKGMPYCKLHINMNARQPPPAPEVWDYPVSDDEEEEEIVITDPVSDDEEEEEIVITEPHSYFDDFIAHHYKKIENGDTDHHSKVLGLVGDNIATGFASLAVSDHPEIKKQTLAYVMKRRENIKIINAKPYDENPDLVCTDWGYLQQLIHSVGILKARDLYNTKMLSNAEKSYKNEWIQATQKVGELKKQIKQKNLEIDGLRRVKKERKKIKALEQQLDETQHALLEKQLEDMVECSPPSYSEN
jgi:hypothetical protein